MPVRKRAMTQRRPALRPETLSREAKAWRRAARQTHDPEARQKFEEMAADRETVARAIEESEAEQPPED
jgi:hypothetical protein